MKLFILLISCAVFTITNTKINAVVSCKSDFCKAVKTGNYPLAEKMLKRNAKLANETINSDISVLNLAILDQDLSMVKLLIKYKADVNSRSVGGSTPLHAAARVGAANITKILLENSANIDSFDSEGYTPTMRAASLGKSGAVEILLEYKPNCSLRSENGTSLRSISRNKLTHEASKKLEEYLRTCQAS